MRNDAGFTLLEAVVALVIVGLAAVAALQAFAGELRTTTRGIRALQAETLAEHRLALARLVDSDQLRALPDSIAKGEFQPPLDDYHWMMATEPVPGEPDLCDVLITVSWEGGSYALRTRLYRPSVVAIAR